MGEALYLRVEGLQPSWRQGLVLTSKRRGAQLQLAVRVTDKELEIDEKWRALSYFELHSEKFILVDGDIDRTRKTCLQPHRALEVATDVILQKGLAMLGEDDLQFATASEEVEEKREKPKKATLDSSGSGESSSEESDGDALLKLLEKAKSSRADVATSSDRRGRPSTSRKKSSLRGGIGAQCNRVIFRGDRKTSRSWSCHAGISSGQKGNAETSCSPHPTLRQRGGVSDGGDRGVGLQTLRLFEETGMGKHRSLMRIHFAVSEALEQLLKGKTKLAGLQLVQLLRGVHQCSLDGGDWRTAWLLLHLPDPVERPRFGGEVQELEVVASYVKALNELERKNRALNSAADRVEEESEAGKGKKGKGKKKQQQGDDPVVA